MNKKNSGNIVRCELCTREATLYCAADSAFLCNTCDASVHGANFIVARHVRHLLCSNCGSLYAPGPPGTSCDSCNPDQDDDDDPVDEDCLSSSSSSCSACVSITAESIEIMRRRHQKGVKSTATTGVITEDSVCSMGHVEESRTNHRHGPPCRVKYSWMTDREGKLDRKAVEWVFRSWCRRLLGDERSSSEITSHHEHEVVVAAATRALRMCMGVGVLPMRVALAASFWVALSTTMSRRRMSPSVPMSMSLLKRLQEICGVPGRLILMMAERRVARLFRATAAAAKQKGCHRQLLQDQEEGWGES